MKIHTALLRLISFELADLRTYSDAVCLICRGAQLAVSLE